jgi:FkbM family methyltransferase
MSALNMPAVAASAKAVARRFTRRARLARRISPFLPEAICVDVGASYYPHGKWQLFLESPRTQWIAVEPNEANIGYVRSWPWQCQVSTCTKGLSKTGGNQTLYITNVDSGSSLLEPKVPLSMSRRMRHLDYLFPMRTREIDTLTLAEAIGNRPVDVPMLVKLDTQGTELSILSGAEDLIKSRRIIGVELEATLLAQPVMQGAGKFWEVCRYLESLDFELVHIKPIYGPSRYGTRRPHAFTFLNECDAVFALRQDVAAELPVEHRTVLLAFYLSNRFFEESLSMLEEDQAVKAYLVERGCPVEKLTATIRAMA